MKLGACALLFAALLMSGPAMAQDAEPSAEVAIPDVPAGPATLRGQVVHAEDPVGAGDVEVLLYALPAAGTPGLRRARTDADGRFAFESIAATPSTAYLVGARFQGVPFPGARVQFADGELEREVSLRVGPTTADPNAVATARSEIRLRWIGNRLSVTENHTLRNDGAQTFYVPPAARETARAAFRVELPEGAEGFATPLGIAPEGLLRDGPLLRFFGPVFPTAWDEPGAGEQDFAFQYSLLGKGEVLALTRRFVEATGGVVVVAPEGTPLRIPNADEPESVMLEGRPAKRWTLGPETAGSALEIALDVPKASTDLTALRIPEVRVFLELDDTALQVQEQHLLEVSGEAAVMSAGEPILRIPLPEGARDVRFDRAAFALGLEADDTGGLTLLGPIPPGETQLEIGYRLPVDETTRFDKRVGRELPLLSIYIADTGVELTSTRLHRRRPVRTPDRLYLHMEAFQIEPDETVSLALTPIRATEGPGRALRYGVLALAAALGAAFLAGPLRREDANAVPVEASESRRERDALYVALRDLEHDYETGKVADSDYERMRVELRGRALALLQEEQRASGATPATASAEREARLCAGCHAALRGDDRFCSQCGAPSQLSAERPA